MAHSSVACYIHVIFATKNREPLIFPDIEDRLYAYLGGIASKKKTPLIRINGVHDHVHLLMKLHPDVALSILVKELKSYSTGWIKNETKRNFSWQTGYGGYSCSITHVDALIKYIENQKVHHKASTLDQELERINKKWGTSWHP
jgi:putative transposase